MKKPLGSLGPGVRQLVKPLEPHPGNRTPLNAGRAFPMRWPDTPARQDCEFFCHSERLGIAYHPALPESQ